MIKFTIDQIQPCMMASKKFLKEHDRKTEMTMAEIVEFFDVDAGIWVIRFIEGHNDKKEEFARTCCENYEELEPRGVVCACPYARKATIAAIYERESLRTNAEKQAVVEKQGKDLIRIFG